MRTELRRATQQDNRKRWHSNGWNAGDFLEVHIPHKLVSKCFLVVVGDEAEGKWANIML